VTSGDEVEAFGADLRVTNDGVGIPAYQRVGAATAGSSTAAGTADYDSTGFPPYLRFDGTDDSMATSAIDLTATDKMSVFAGVRRLSNVYGFMCELTTGASANNGALSMYFFTDTKLYFGSKGTTYREANTNAATIPITNVFTGLGDISAPSVYIKENGVTINTNTLSQGTGNYANAGLYIGSRAGTSLRFNGRLYSLIVRGAASTAGQISDTETWVNGKTKAYV
jgi:hypothetical protein